MIVAFYYEKERTVTLMKRYADTPFCTYRDVEDVSALCGGSGNVWRITLKDGSKAYVTCSIMEVR